jgi:hypothetical protein
MEELVADPLDAEGRARFVAGMRALSDFCTAQPQVLDEPVSESRR